MIGKFRLLAFTIGVLCAPFASEAQQNRGLPNGSVLVIDSERLFNDSAYGQRVLSEQQADAAVLAAEYRRIEAELSEEERALTEQRQGMDPADFRKVADAFDDRVESIRATQEQREIDLAQRSDAARQQFFSLLRPVFQAVLSESGAVVVLERRTVFASSNALDVTDLIIEQADLLIGDGVDDDPDNETDEN